MRLLILGNGGSGKSWLARELADVLDIEHIEMDRIFWEPGGYNKKRDKEEVHKESERISKMDNWIVEGVFGEIADLLIDSATHLIWLDFDWNYCLENLNKRGPQFEDSADQSLVQKSFDELIIWTSKYDTRQTKASLWYHQQLFNSFKGIRHHISEPNSLGGIIEGIKSVSGEK